LHSNAELPEPFAKHRYCRLGLLLRLPPAIAARVKVAASVKRIIRAGSRHGGGSLGADRSVTSHDNFLRGHGNAGSNV
jgi:hypothetical protein